MIVFIFLLSEHFKKNGKKRKKTKKKSKNDGKTAKPTSFLELILNEKFSFRNLFLFFFTCPTLIDKPYMKNAKNKVLFSIRM